MSGDERLTELLRTASGALGDDLSTDPRALIARARHKRRRQLAVGAVAMVVSALLGASVIPSMRGGDEGVELATGDPDSGPPPVWADPPAPGWTRLPDAPLSPRIGATVISTGNEVVVVGGTTQLCAAGEACVPDPGQDLTDGAAFSLTTRTWRQIAPPPTVFRPSQAIAIGGDVFLLPRCTPPGTGCDSLVRYRPADEAWNLLPLPPLDANSSMSRLGGDLVVYGDPEGRAPVIWRLEIARTTWTKLPTDPLPPDAARVLDADGDDLLLFALEVGRDAGSSSRVLAARFEGAKGRWSVLPPAPGSGFQAEPLDGVAVQGSSNVPPGSAVRQPEGGVFKPRSGSWQPLPADGWRQPPAVSDVTAPRSGVVGVLRRTTAEFEHGAGLVLDVEANRWIELPPVDDRSTTSIAPVGRRLFQFGGARSGQLLNDAWVWTPPTAAEPFPATTTPTPTTAPVPTPSPTTSAATPTAGAPQYLSATGDASAGRVTVRFDRPVTGDPPIITPDGGINPPGRTSPMSLVIFGADQACSAPAGNGHEYLDGLGTDTITTDASTLVPGTTYIGIAAGFVKSVADGTFNGTVQVKDARPTAWSPGMSCIPINVTGSVPQAPPTTDAPNAPQLVSATGDATLGRVTLRFSRPVVPGDGAGPTNPDERLKAMQLVVYGPGDTACSSPAGNAHEYLSGVGTDTLVTDASSLVPGTTYLSIGPGFARGASDGVPMRGVRCLAIDVKG